MNFLPMKLYKKERVGTDALNNPIYDYVYVEDGKTEGRFSSWSEKEVALDNRNVTQNNRKIVTPASKAQLQEAEKVYFEEQYHSITDIKGDEYTRWRILVVSRYGSDSL